jgi:hypothetical protein
VIFRRDLAHVLCALALIATCNATHDAHSFVDALTLTFIGAVVCAVALAIEREARRLL